MGIVGDFLFELFWIITGFTLDILALSIAFWLFAAVWKYFYMKKEE